MLEQMNSTIDSLRVFWVDFLRFLPQLFIGLVLLLLGWLIARLLRKGIVILLKLVRVDVIAEKAGIDDYLLKGGAQYSTVNLIGNLFYWFIMLSLTLMVLHLLGLDAAKAVLNNILLFVPNMLAAILVIIFGMFAAKLVRGAIYTYLTNAGISGAEFVSTIVYWAVIFVVLSIALQQISLAGQLLIIAFGIAFGGLCLALAIAFGLAGKEWATQILEKLWRNSR